MQYTFFYIILLTLTLNANSLLGRWVSKTSQGSVNLEFVSDSKLIYDAEQMPYIISGNSIRVPAEYGYVDYPYTLDKNTLRISFPEGYQLSFKRVKERKSNSKRDNTYLLSGRLCNFTSSFDGGYSTTTWVYFDGKGHFSTNSGSSYSGNNGAYYGQGGKNGGTYSVNSDNISIDANGGYHYDAYVIERQRNGKITGININGKVYGSAICE